MRSITLGHLNISEKGKSYVNDALNNNRLSYGPYTKKFEQEFAAMHECKHGIFMNSGTSALQVALAALKEVHGYQDGDDVLVPATTFIATSNIVLQNGLTPVFVDVDPETYNLDPYQVSYKLTGRTKAIIPVHLFGLSCDMKMIMSLAKIYNLRVIEDSCEAVGSTFNGKPVGSFGDMSCFSTYINHLVIGGVGGLVLTNDDKLAEISRSLMAHGRDSVYTSIDSDDGLSGSKLQNIIERRFRFERLGYSYRATEMEAALALAGLQEFEENVAMRRKNAALLIKLLEDLKDYIQLPYTPPGSTHAYMMMPLVCKTGVDRDKLLLFLEERGIETRYLFPLLSQPVYVKKWPCLAEKYPVAEHLAHNGFMIGSHNGLTEEDIAYISDTFHQYFEAGK